MSGRRPVPAPLAGRSAGLRVGTAVGLLGPLLVPFAACGEPEDRTGQRQTLQRARPGARPPSGTQVPALFSDVSFSRSGGLAGYDEQLVIAQEGAARLTTGNRQTSADLTPNQVIELAILLEQSGLFDQDREFVSAGADLIGYSIGYSGVTICVDEEQVLAELRPALDWLLERLRSLGAEP